MTSITYFHMFRRFLFPPGKFDSDVVMLLLPFVIPCTLDRGISAIMICFPVTARNCRFHIVYNIIWNHKLENILFDVSGRLVDVHWLFILDKRPIWNMSKFLLSLYLSPASPSNCWKDGQIDWSGGPETMEEILSRINQREKAAVKRERAMAYAFSHQVFQALTYTLCAASVWMNQINNDQTWFAVEGQP